MSAARRRLNAKRPAAPWRGRRRALIHTKGGPMSNATTASTDPWLAWVWQHGSLSVFECETRDEALRLAASMEESEAGLMAHVEGPDGECVPTEELAAALKALDASRRTEAQGRPRPTHSVILAAPDGKGSATWDAYPSSDEAESAAASLRDRFGDRVSVRAIRGTAH